MKQKKKIFRDIKGNKISEDTMTNVKKLAEFNEEEQDE